MVGFMTLRFVFAIFVFSGDSRFSGSEKVFTVKSLAECEIYKRGEKAAYGVRSHSFKDGDYIGDIVCESYGLVCFTVIRATGNYGIICNTTQCLHGFDDCFVIIAMQKVCRVECTRVHCYPSPYFECSKFRCQETRVRNTCRA
jgi:hypothetical protein